MAKVLIIDWKSGIGLESAKIFKANNYNIINESRSSGFDYNETVA